MQYTAVVMDTAVEEVHKMIENIITVLVVSPRERPKVKQILPDLKSLQTEVGGLIDVIYPFPDPVALVCNDLGKIVGLPHNRALYDAKGKICDTIAGTFLIAGLGENGISSLSPALVAKYEKRFAVPELILSIGGKITVYPMD